MNHQAADALAKRIVGSWRSGPPLQDWVDTLDPLDEGAAGTAYIRLRNEHEGDRAPSCATFRKMYHSLETAATAPIRQETCPLNRCAGDGWIVGVFTAEERTYEGVEPCGCPVGRNNEQAYKAASR